PQLPGRERTRPGEKFSARGEGVFPEGWLEFGWTREDSLFFFGAQERPALWSPSSPATRSARTGLTPLPGLSPTPGTVDWPFDFSSSLHLGHSRCLPGDIASLSLAALGAQTWTNSLSLPPVRWGDARGAGITAERGTPPGLDGGGEQGEKHNPPNPTSSPQGLNFKPLFLGQARKLGV
ncbi:hypothetical protein H1C71_039958, partial [Ictidomys tridecemlineatus]